MITYISDCKVD